MPLLDSRGEPITSMAFAKATGKKATVVVPKVGDIFGSWAGRDVGFVTLPGGGVMQFDLSRLTLTDFRGMRLHYQLGASLNVLAFIMHQIDWRIECDDPKIGALIEGQMRNNWTTLIRGVSQAFWCGFAPTAVNYANALDGSIEITQFKDMVPEECRVEWKKNLGWAPLGKAQPTIYSYNGFYANGSYIPPENSFWYPLLMENGDYYGRKLLKPAFPAWYFSNLIHLFSNRYFERFGEPLPIGRGRFDDEVDMGNGVQVNGKLAMEQVVQNIRNRAVVVLPSDRDPVTKEYDYDIQYLESQMRGADFERYLSRLDEEMSLAVFTPMLLFRTTQVGSYNLGDMHYRVFQQELNAIAGDMQTYFQKFIVDRLRVLNFGQNSPIARWTYRKEGQGNVEQYKELMSILVQQGVAQPDLKELGAIVGLKFDEITQITAPPTPPGGGPAPTPTKPASKATTAPKATTKAARAVMYEAVLRAAREVGKGNKDVTLGYKNRFYEALQADGWSDADAHMSTQQLFTQLNAWIADAAPVVAGGQEMREILTNIVTSELDSMDA